MNDDTAATGSVLRRELARLWRAFWRGAKRSFLVTFGVVTVWGLWVTLSDGTQEQSVVASVIVSVGAGTWMGLWAGVIFGLASMSWAMVGAWTLVPLATIPLAVYLGISAMSGVLFEQLHSIRDAAVQAGREHEWLVLSLGPAARAGPVILVVALPLLLIDLGAVALEPSVLWALFVLAVQAAVAVAIGFVPAVLLNAVVLLVVYVRRLRQLY